jgi:hypothetical protein
MRKKVLRIPQNWRPFALYNALLLLFAAGGSVYLALAARAPALFACAFARQSHLYCPGCGGSRALLALLRLDVLGSLAANPSLIAGIATLVYYEIALYLSSRGRARVRPWPAIAYAALILAFFIIRNLLLVLCGIDPLGDQIGYWS